MTDIVPAEAEETVYEFIEPQEGPQKQFVDCEADIAFYGGQAGGGKALCVETLIPTPRGWSRLADLNDGDIVFSEDGSQTQIVKAHDVFVPAECFRLVFDDGTEVDACGDHLWKTFNASELDALLKRSDEYRRKRRVNRPSRAKYPLSARSAALIERNKTRNPAISKPLPAGTVRTTKEMSTTLVAAQGRANHAIWNAKPIVMNHAADLPLDPYMLGVWLGDGTVGTGVYSKPDIEIADRLRSKGFVVTLVPSSEYSFRVEGLTTILRLMGVLKTKHVPREYLRSSIEQRRELLAGLCDTDGYCAEDGTVEFSSTDECLATAVFELVGTIGDKCTIHEGRAMLNGKDCGPKWRVFWSPIDSPFLLKRKAERHRLVRRRTTRMRYLKSCDRIISKPMRCLTVEHPSKMFLIGRTFLPTHNTWGLLVAAGRWAHVPGFGAVIFRREAKQITNEGGLWDETMQMYGLPGIDGVPRVSRYDWSFPSGASIGFSAIEYEKDLKNWQGSQIAFLGFDEVTHFSKAMFLYMIGRARTKCGIRPHVRATCNPIHLDDPVGGWVHDILQWWIDPDTGIVIPERSGVWRWLVVKRGEFLWANSKEECFEKYRIKDLPDDHKKQIKPKSITFIEAKLEDNPALEENDPDYRGNLEMQEDHVRQQLLEGNWNARRQAGTFFKVAKAEIVEAVPADLKFARGWDLAATDGDGDWTVGIKMGCDDRGIFYISDVIRGQWESDYRDQMIRRAAETDGPQCQVSFPQDPAAAGKSESARMIRMMQGHWVTSSLESGDKTIRARGFQSQFNAGNVKLLRGPWTNGLLSRMDAFPTKGIPDDEIDSLSRTFDALCSQKKLVMGFSSRGDSDDDEKPAENPYKSMLEPVPEPEGPPKPAEPQSRRLIMGFS